MITAYEVSKNPGAVHYKIRIPERGASVTRSDAQRDILSNTYL